MKTLLAAIAAALVLTACAPTMPPRAAISAPTITQAQGRMYVFLGKINTYDMNKVGTAGNVFVNGKQTVAINRGEYAAIDVAPGTYELTWVPLLSDMDLSRHTTQPKTVTVTGGQEVYLAANTLTGAFSDGSLGVMGAALGGKLVDSFEVTSLSPTSVRLVEHKVFTP